MTCRGQLGRNRSGEADPAEPVAGEPLVGGNSNAPVRVGDTVHRVAGPWTPTVHALLRHLHERGVAWVPEPLGLDDVGREVLSFLPGEVPRDPFPPYVWTDAVLVDAGQALRVFHDATRDFAREGSGWQQPVHTPTEVVCHNDFAPYNFVFNDERLTGVIDVDMASPGPRVRDLCYLAYRLVPLMAPTNSDGLPLPLEQRAARLRRLCDSYGELTPHAVLAAVPERLRELARYTDARATVLPELAEHAVRYRADADWVERNPGRLLGAA